MSDMNYSYAYKYTFGDGDYFDVDSVNDFCMRHPYVNKLVEVANTRGISSSDLKRLDPSIMIRIAGGYDKYRLEHAPQSQDYLYSSVIYTRNEAIKIVEEMEKIESGIRSNWSDLQKVIYVYDSLKSGVLYDPKYEEKSSDEIRSLRGLITKQTVCAGYSLMFKEMMDRLNIPCQYVEGRTEKGTGHAWNLVTIDGKLYPVDVTFDNSRYQAGFDSTYYFLGQNVESFAKNHRPRSYEPVQDYRHTLSQINLDLIRQISSQFDRSKTYTNSTYLIARQDGSQFVISQVGNFIADGYKLNRYYYCDVLSDGTLKNPQIFFSESNVMGYKKNRDFGKKVPTGYGNVLFNIVFSKENIQDSIDRDTMFLGNVTKKSSSNHSEVVQSVSEIEKPDDLLTHRRDNIRVFKRSDGTSFIAERRTFTQKPCGFDIYKYDIFEMVLEDNKYVLKKNTVFTERDFFNDPRLDMADVFLSRARLNRKVNEAGSYIGYYASDNHKYYNPDLVDYFDTSKRINVDDLVDSIEPKPLPTFDEIKNLASRYEIFTTSGNPLEEDFSKYKIRDIKTKEVEENPEIVEKAMFANMWLTAAGVNWTAGDKRVGDVYAFNSSAEEIYHSICQDMTKQVEQDGVIDTVGIFRDISSHSLYKYNQEIVANLFRTPIQVQFINDLALRSVGKSSQSKVPEPLYSVGYASNLAYSVNNHVQK